MGYYTEYFSTLLKSDWALATKQRWDSRRVVRYSRQADKMIYEVIPEKIEVEHKVTEALKDEKKAIEAIKEVIKYGLQLAFNSSYEDEIILRTIKHLIESMAHFMEIVEKVKRDPKLASNQKLIKMEAYLEDLCKKFAIMLRNQTQKAQGQEREEMKEVMTLIQQSHEYDKDAFMTAVKQKFSSIKSQTLLARYAFRSDIQHEKKLVSALEKLAPQLEQQRNWFEKISKDINKLNKDLPKAVDGFKNIVEESAQEIQGAFFYAYKIKKRDFNMMLTMMVNADILKKLNVKWVKMHFLPIVPAQERMQDIENLEKKLGEKIHTMAQALRIQISAQDDLAKKAMPLLQPQLSFRF